MNNQFRYTDNSKPFSFEQKIPFFISLIGFLQFLFIIPLILYFEYKDHSDSVGEILLIWLACSVPAFILFGICLNKFSIALCRVVLREDGIEIVGFRNKSKRFLQWEQIKYYHVSNIAGETKYVCLSTDEKIAMRYLYYPGLIWTIFQSRQTISMVVNPGLLAYLNHHIGELRKNVGRYKTTKDEENKLLKRYHLMTLLSLAICGIVLLFIFLMCA